MLNRSIRFLFVALVILATSAVSFAQIGVGISVSFGPPAIPIYAQPVLPGPGYIWTPGYWAYSDDGGYYWVPGTWVLAPQPGFLWTPGYWGWEGGAFFWHVGYWGPRIGFYGGINYGFGYFGVGFQGGRWENGQFFYNRAVNNVNVTNVTNVYNTTVINNTENRVSYNGGEGGVNARPTAEEQAAESERHIPPVAEQTQHEAAARSNPQQFAAANHGKPPVAATPKPGALNDRGVVQAKQAGAPYNPPANRGEAKPAGNAMASHPEENAGRSAPSGHVKDLPPAEHSVAPNTGNPKLDKQYQQEQDKLYQKQQQERQKLQQQQEQEHQKMAQQKASDAKVQQMEQRHQQQTQQLQQKHAQEQQKLQQNQKPSNPGGGKPPKP